jgi:hypothetical protein
MQFLAFSSTNILQSLWIKYSSLIERRVHFILNIVYNLNLCY